MLYVNNKTLIWYSFDEYMINHYVCHEFFKCLAIMLKLFNKFMSICYMKNVCVPHALTTTIYGQKHY